MIPTIGRIVHYTLTGYEAESINKRRADAMRAQSAAAETGYVVHFGNQVQEGQVYPLLITRVWGEGEGAAVNGQVFLDGNDVYWATSRVEGDEPGQWRVPERIAS